MVAANELERVRHAALSRNLSCSHCMKAAWTWGGGSCGCSGRPTYTRGMDVLVSGTLA